MVLTPNDNSDARPGYPPTREDLFWVAAMRRVLVDSMSGILHVATIISLLSGIGLLGYLGWLLSPWAVGRVHGLFARVIILLPAVLWAGAAFYGALALLARRYRYFANSPDSSRLAFRRINRKKAQHLNRAFAFWLTGVVAVLVVALVL